MTSAERWRAIPGHVRYEASDQGRIRRAPGARGKGARPGHVLHPSRDKYDGVQIYDGHTPGRPIYRHVHVLVAAAWLGPCPAGHEVAHLNDDRTDNRLVNLAYQTPSQNRPRGPRNGRGGMPGEANHRAVLTDAAVIALRTTPYRRGDAKRLSEQYGVSVRTIHEARRGETWKHLLKMDSEVTCV